MVLSPVTAVGLASLPAGAEAAVLLLEPFSKVQAASQNSANMANIEVSIFFMVSP
jgi:hypothetical protein